MSVANPPAESADVQKVRDEWVRAVDQLVTQVEGWCQARDWPTRRIPKRIEEEPIGGYEVPALVFQIDLLKLMLEPDHRVAVRSDGVVRLYRMPEYDTVARVCHSPGGWAYFADVEPEKLPPERRPTGPGPALAEIEGPFDRDAFFFLVGLMT